MLLVVLLGCTSGTGVPNSSEATIIVEDSKNLPEQHDSGLLPDHSLDCADCDDCSRTWLETNTTLIVDVLITDAKKVILTALSIFMKKSGLYYLVCTSDNDVRHDRLKAVSIGGYHVVLIHGAETKMNDIKNSWENPHNLYDHENLGYLFCSNNYRHDLATFLKVPLQF